MVSGGLGAAIWAATGSPAAVPIALATGVFTDVDHAIDIFDPRDGRYSRYMLRPFHAWEFTFVGLGMLGVLGFWDHPLFLAAVLGYTSHLVIDQLGNHTHPLAYFISYRASHGFKRRHLTPHLFEKSYRVLRGPIPLWGKLEPRLYRIYLRIRTGERW